MPCNTQASPADLIRGQVGNVIVGNSQTVQGSITSHQQPILIKSGSVTNYSISRFPPGGSGNSIFQNLTKWETPAMSPLNRPTATGFVTTGTVTWVPVEGGFFGIISDDGKRYDPLNLPAEYAKDGMRVGFTAKTDPDATSFHMWGIGISITDIHPISQDGSYRQGVFVHYERYGGIFGNDDQLTIYENRTTVVRTKTGGKTFIITPMEMADLVSVFDSTGFDSVDQEYLQMFTLGIAADYFDYVIEFRGHKIHSPQLAIPESLQPLIDALDEIVRNGE